MSWFYRNILRPVLFKQNAEDIHNRTMRALAFASRHKPVCAAMHSWLGAPELPVELFGLKFPNPVGLAAGMDKHAAAVPAWAAMASATPNSAQRRGTRNPAIPCPASSAPWRRRPS